MEAMNERERHFTNPMRLLRGVVELLAIKVDDALDVEFNPYDYPLVAYESEAPVATEEELDERAQRPDTL